MNGGLDVRAASTGLVLSRRKNLPKPPRTAVFPFLNTSQATPILGAIFLKLFFLSERFENSVGVVAPAMPVHGFVPFGTTRPLQGIAPRAGLYKLGRNELISLSLS